MRLGIDAMPSAIFLTTRLPRSTAAVRMPFAAFHRACGTFLIRLTTPFSTAVPICLIAFHAPEKSPLRIDATSLMTPPISWNADLTCPEKNAITGRTTAMICGQ